MNNIEILEDLEKYISFANKQCNFSNDADYKWHKELAQAIENLIQENKELKERIKGLECEIEIKKYCKVDEVINDLTYYKNLAKEYQGSCIPKSKIKEKIEELDKRKRKSQIEYSTIDELIFDKKIEALQELLEEGDDK